MSLKYAILGLLLDNPYYGYEIKQKFENNLGDIWPISYGQLYPTLRRLTEIGYVVKQTETGKKAIDKNVYHITEKGRQHFKVWFEKIPKKTHVSIKDEFTMLFLFLGNVEKGRIKEVVLKQKKYVSAYLDRYRRTLSGGYGSSTNYYQKTILKKLIYHLEAELSWLEDILSEQKPYE